MTAAATSRAPIHHPEFDAGDEENPIWWAGERRGRHLVIFVQGFGAAPAEYGGLLEVIRTGSGADVYAPKYAGADLLAGDDPHAVTADLAERFNEYADGYEEVHFVGHSMGAPFLREAFLKGLGVPESPTPLRSLLENGAIRMTFLAGTSRGYTPTGLLQSLRLELLRRWYWLTLFTVAIAWSLRAGLPWGGVSVAESWIPLAAAAIFIPIYLAIERLLDREADAGIQFLVGSVGAWLTWAVTGWPPLSGVAIVLQMIGTSQTAGFLARNFRDRLAMTAGVAAIAAAAPWIAAHPSYVWPATLLILLPLVLYPMHSRLLLEHVLYGAPWIAGVRLRWIKTFSQPCGLKPPPFVHLFGEEDRLVGDDDHVEFHHGDDPVELAIRGAAHNDFQISQKHLEREQSIVAQNAARTTRRDAFAPSLLEAVRRAVGENPQERLRELGDQGSAPAKAFAASVEAPAAFRLVEPLRTQQRAQAEAATGGKGPKHVVFLVHGIRDFAGWTDSLAAKCREVAVDNGLLLIEPVQVRYGYFNAFQFLLSAERERATRSFLDLYTQTKARYPNAICSAAAHSNGTYVVANALSNNEYIELERLYLAGSVLTRDFDWAAVGPNRPPKASDVCGLIRDRVRSDRAAQDWPVGVLCWLLAGLGRLPFLKVFYGMLGTGGLRGFIKRNDAGGSEFVFENAYLPGPHGEALNAKYHREIAEFLLTGQSVETGHLLARAPDRKTIRGVLVLTMAGIASVAAAFILPALVGPACPAWGIAVGALTMMIVARAVMTA